MNNLQTTGTVNGQSGFDNGSGGIPGFSTSVGELFITSDTRAAGTHAPWVMCRYRNDEQITVAMFVNDKHRPQFEATAVRKR